MLIRYSILSWVKFKTVNNLYTELAVFCLLIKFSLFTLLKYRNKSFDNVKEKEKRNSLQLIEAENNLLEHCKKFLKLLQTFQKKNISDPS